MYVTAEPSYESYVRIYKEWELRGYKYATRHVGWELREYQNM